MSILPCLKISQLHNGIVYQYDGCISDAPGS